MLNNIGVINLKQTKSSVNRLSIYISYKRMDEYFYPRYQNHSLISRYECTKMLVEK